MAATSDKQARSREAGRAALNGAGHALLAAEATRLARRGAQRRTTAAGAETATIRHRDPPGPRAGTLGRLQWWLSTR